MKKTTLITIGDPAGIGPEIVSKALRKKSVRNASNYIVFGHYHILKKYQFPSSKNINLIEGKKEYASSLKIGQPNIQSAQASLDYLKAATLYLKNETLSKLVTAPICKENICKNHPHFIGHTEFLAHAFHIKHVDMMFVGPNIRTVIITRHIPLKNVASSINKNNIYNSISLTVDALNNYFHIKNPKIAICGINPHAGEGGLLGKEEQFKVIPAIKKAQKKWKNISGPHSADTLFAPTLAKNFDAIIAMYHDQGLGPMKALYFNQLVNFTIGLPIIRTCPAHGTAFNITGQNKADPSSMISAIQLANKLKI